MITAEPDTDTDTLEFDADLPCEGLTHARGLQGHVPASPGAYFVTAPCCGPKIIVCSPRVAAMRFHGVITCHLCKKEWVVEAYDIQRIPAH